MAVDGLAELLYRLVLQNGFTKKSANDSMPNKDIVSIALPTTGFKRFMVFNRFAIERDESFVHIHFGYVNKGGALVDSYSTAISELEVRVLRKTTMDYLGSQGALLDAPPPWQPPTSTRIELANHLVMSHHGKVAETVLYSYSHWSVLQEAKNRTALRETRKNKESLGGFMAEGMALLRSPLRVQQHLIRLLFPDDDSLLTNE